MRQFKHGFTIIELLVVISIMAVVASLVTGAALKSVKQARRRRVEVMVRVLETGLQAYRTQENEWPFTISQLERDPITENFESTPRYWAHTTDNYKVFEKMLRKMNSEHKHYFDTSALMVRGGLLRDSVKNGQYNKPIGYIDPYDSSRFRYFCVEYNQLTDSVRVHWRNHNSATHRSNAVLNMKGDSFKCPKDNER